MPYNNKQGRLKSARMLTALTPAAARQALCSRLFCTTPSTREPNCTWCPGLVLPACSLPGFSSPGCPPGHGCSKFSTPLPTDNMCILGLKRHPCQEVTSAVLLVSHEPNPGIWQKCVSSGLLYRNKVPILSNVQGVALGLLILLTWQSKNLIRIDRQKSVASEAARPSHEKQNEAESREPRPQQRRHIDHLLLGSTQIPGILKSATVVCRHPISVLN